MLLLGLGLLVFLGVHCLPMLPATRARLATALGENRYRGLFALVSAVGLVLLVWGKAKAPYVPVLSPPRFGRSATFVLLAGTAVAFAAMYLPTNLKRVTAHPMLWGTAFWALGHLLSNGDLAALLLFGSFLIFALVDMASANRRGARPSVRRLPLWRDLVVLLVAIALYGAALYGHPHFAGVRLVGTVAPSGASSCPGCA
jgi:uncharacterized membrane protein